MCEIHSLRQDFHGGPMAETPCSQHGRALASLSCPGNWIPHVAAESPHAPTKDPKCSTEDGRCRGLQLRPNEAKELFLKNSLRKLAFTIH